MIKKILKTAECTILTFAFIYIIIALFIGIDSANKMVIDVVKAFTN